VIDLIEHLKVDQNARQTTEIIPK